MTAMVEPTDDRLTPEQLLVIAADARYGGFLSRIRFMRAFHPHRVLALLHRVEDSDRALRTLEKEWSEQCMQLEARLVRMSATLDRATDAFDGCMTALSELIGKWRAIPGGKQYAEALAVVVNQVRSSLTA